MNSWGKVNEQFKKPFVLSKRNSYYGSLLSAVHSRLSTICWKGWWMVVIPFNFTLTEPKNNWSHLWNWYLSCNIQPKPFTPAVVNVFASKVEEQLWTVDKQSTNSSKTICSKQNKHPFLRKRERAREQLIMGSDHILMTVIKKNKNYWKKSEQNTLANWITSQKLPQKFRNLPKMRQFFG